MFLYGAIAATLAATFLAHRAWGPSIAVGFGVINVLVILFFPLGQYFGLAAAGFVLSKSLREQPDQPDQETEEEPTNT